MTARAVSAASARSGCVCRSYASEPTSRDSALPGVTRSRGGRCRTGHRIRTWMHLRWIALVVVLAVAAPASAHASQLIDRNATHVRLEVNRQGRALVTYRANGRLRHVLAWNAMDAVPPSAGRA